MAVSNEQTKIGHILDSLAKWQTLVNNISNKLHKNIEITTILLSPTDNRSTIETDMTKVPNNKNILTSEYKDKSYE